MRELVSGAELWDHSWFRLLVMIHLVLQINLAVVRICTQEECLLSDPQGESDADADIEDTDCRLAAPAHVCVRACVRSPTPPWPDQLFYVLSDSRSRGRCSELARVDASGRAFQGRTPRRAKTTVGGATNPIAGTSG